MNDTDNSDFYKPYLADQERVLWIGKPGKRKAFYRSRFCHASI